MIDETLYRRILRLYPASYRAGRGEEIITTLRETGGGFREVVALLTGAFAAHARSRTTPWQADGLHLGILVIALHRESGELMGVDGGIDAWLIMLTLVLMILGRPRLALPAAAASMWVGHDYFPPDPGPWVVLAGLLVLALLPRRHVGRRSWLWLAVPAVMVTFPVPMFYLYADIRKVLISVAVQGAFLLLAIAATAMSRDYRWALAAAIWMGVEVARFHLSEQLAWYSTRDWLYFGASALLVVAAFAVAYRRRKVV
ncbi:hypothetical protein FDA94_34415 [Herbidospora galbida]|uniref:Uncharacterized protein n=1 Tax=Herbidospora galbida TaxID=2575442 RepID=A0A4U3LXT7_9ACTN|nr:hypothetical protein [Herbidospora galbida]TKK81001.1 hypothetical protein FDA94_34415 [Herbidospora galbida]